VFCFKNKSEKNKSGSLEPDLLVVAVVTVLIRGSNRCGEFVAVTVIYLSTARPSVRVFMIYASLD